MTWICYVDESGSEEPLDPSDPNSTPVLVVLGLVLAQECLLELTHDYIDLKKSFYPGLFKGRAHFLECVLDEVKASDLRRDLRHGQRRAKRTCIGFLDRLFDLVEKHDAMLVGRVWIKAPVLTPDGQAIYAFSIQDICTHFQHFLASRDDTGIMIADSRNPQKNSPISFSVFTQKFKKGGDAYERLLEMPVFGHSDNHVGIQVADILAGIVFAVSSRVYCQGHVSGPHVHPSYDLLRARYGVRLQQLQYRYEDLDLRWRGGLVVADQHAHRPGSLLFT